MRPAGALADHHDVGGEILADSVDAVDVVVGEIGHRQDDVVEPRDGTVGEAAPVVAMPAAQRGRSDRPERVVPADSLPQTFRETD